ncbi:MAG: Succinate dehydrogenase flavoprotein subunit, partial [uncultured Rubrobacteraceae bacterium]
AKRRSQERCRPHRDRRTDRRRWCCGAAGGHRVGQGGRRCPSSGQAPPPRRPHRVGGGRHQRLFGQPGPQRPVGDTRRRHHRGGALRQRPEGRGDPGPRGAGAHPGASRLGLPVLPDGRRGAKPALLRRPVLPPHLLRWGQDGRGHHGHARRQGQRGGRPL